eukprot:CAMPEP_0202341078 /NCGR_PEP_ID=MMETSP1126-20121109/2239_1 /ASSEMBLY_ACC=CAM_ASM_000457 /TAXON_ID=3047 /ORGANISM="Dunaliella tertiolecta, Strain CCMP1320" /LENGTH=118 /DNA_ID=CAMNT_0048931867 /DNA_START=497 /DNA_END=850 /DNA_ORIENTATION=+
MTSLARFLPISWLRSAGLHDEDGSPLDAQQQSRALQFDHDLGKWFLKMEAQYNRMLRKHELAKALEYAGVACDSTFVIFDGESGKMQRKGVNGMYEQVVACIGELEKVASEAIDVGQW